MRSRTKSRKWAILLSNSFLLSYVQYSTWEAPTEFLTSTQRILLSHLHKESFGDTNTTNLTEPLKKRFLATYMVSLTGLTEPPTRQICDCATYMMSLSGCSWCSRGSLSGGSPRQSKRRVVRRCTGHHTSSSRSDHRGLWGSRCTSPAGCTRSPRTDQRRSIITRVEHSCFSKIGKLVEGKICAKKAEFNFYKETQQLL